MSDHRRERIRRLAAKRPLELRITVQHEPSPKVRDELVDLLLEIIERRRGGGQ